MNESIPQHTRKRNLSTEPVFYAYYLARNNVPFYIGKGKDRRIENHFDCARKQENCKHHACRVIRKEWREGREVIKVKIAEHIPEQAAFDLEKLFISLGAIYNWPLVNKTVGGEGTSGFRRTMSPEEKERNRQRSLERFSDPEERAKHSRGAARRFSDPKEREKQSKRTLQHFSDPKVREEHRRKAQERADNAEEISEEEREIRRQRSLKMWSNPEYREAISKQGLQRYKDPNEIERSRQITKGLWQTPEFRDKMLERNEDPLVKQKKSTAASQRDPNRFGVFDGFVSPENVVHAPVTNLHAFCEEHELSYTGMQLVDRGKQVAHKGWTRYTPPGKTPLIVPVKKRAPITGNEYHAKTYEGFVAPDGTVYTGIKNLARFAREHNLQNSGMCLVAQGKKPSHKGWTKYRPENLVQSTLF